MPDIVIASRMSYTEVTLKTRPLSVSVTTLPLSVASVKGDAVVAVSISSKAVTGSWTVNASL